MHHPNLVEKRKILVLLHDDDEVETVGNGALDPNTTFRAALSYSTSPQQRLRAAVTILNGRSVGLTLGGGFARGLGHAGVIRAMRELGIPIDMVGGTSMGAIIAGQCSVEWSASRMVEESSRRSADLLKGDYTLPFVSLLTGKKFSKDNHGDRKRPGY